MLSRLPNKNLSKEIFNQRVVLVFTQNKQKKKSMYTYLVKSKRKTREKKRRLGGHNKESYLAFHALLFSIYSIARTSTKKEKHQQKQMKASRYINDESKGNISK